LVNLVRAAFEYVDHQMKQHGGDSRAIRCLRCMIGCCLACLAKCIRFISKNSYIHTSIKGDAFCFAAVRSYRLIFKHLLSFGATNLITEILMVVGKIMVCCASMLFSYTWIQYTPKFSEKASPDYLSSTLFISIIVLTLAYLVAESFFNVFNVAIDTILMSYCMVSRRWLIEWCCFVDGVLTFFGFFLSLIIIVVVVLFRILIHHQLVLQVVQLWKKTCKNWVNQKRRELFQLPTNQGGLVPMKTKKMVSLLAAVKSYLLCTLVAHLSESCERQH